MELKCSTKARHIAIPRMWGIYEPHDAEDAGVRHVMPQALTPCPSSGIFGAHLGSSTIILFNGVTLFPD